MTTRSPKSTTRTLRVPSGACGGEELTWPLVELVMRCSVDVISSLSKRRRLSGCRQPSANDLYYAHNACNNALCEYRAASARADLSQRHAAADPRCHLPGARTALHDPRTRGTLGAPPAYGRARGRSTRRGGLLETELRSGRRSVWAATTSPIFDELRSILLKTVGPKAVLEQQLARSRGLERALIYGSWARRYHGEPGPFPQDIDLMVIGTWMSARSALKPTPRHTPSVATSTCRCWPRTNGTTATPGSCPTSSPSQWSC